MNWHKINKIHFVGVGGIGISALAKLALQQNKSVSGSDVYLSEITKELEKLGGQIFQGHRSDNVSQSVDLVVYSAAVPKNNPERLKAEKLGIRQIAYPEFLGELSRGKKTIAVSGTNGKSTTTAILGLICQKAGLDPTVIVGSKVPEWQGNLRLGSSNIFLIEACEWRAHMLNLSPKMIVLTNLEPEHLDFYRDIEQIIETFQKYIDKLPKHGILVLNADDPNVMKLKPRSKIITYGIKNKADVRAKNIAVYSGHQEFDLIQYRRPTSRLRVLANIPGLFNIYNILGASAAALSLGVKIETIKKVVEDFFGIWRRFELVDADKRGYLRGFTPKITLISDYAHHPTAVKGTIQAAREFYPDRRIVAVFQPHHHHRTRKLFNDFVQSFSGADLSIISEIYGVAGRESKKDKNVSSKDLVMAIKKRFNGDNVFYARDLQQTKDLILKNLQVNDLVLIMGAGDIDNVARDLIKK